MAKTNDKKEPQYVDGPEYLVYAFLIWLPLHFYLTVHWLDNRAIEKSKDSRNIKDGCVVFIKTFNTKHGKMYKLKIDNHRFDTMGLIHVINSPFELNYKQFYQDIDNRKYVCYPVKYVKVGIFPYNKIYLFDYLPSN